MGSLQLRLHLQQLVTLTTQMGVLHRLKLKVLLPMRNILLLVATMEVTHLPTTVMETTEAMVIHTLQLVMETMVVILASLVDILATQALVVDILFLTMVEITPSWLYSVIGLTKASYSPQLSRRYLINSCYLQNKLSKADMN